MKIIILIIANDYPDHYLQMQNVWKKYMNTHPNISSYFIKFKKDLNKEVVLDELNNTIWVKGDESLIPGVLDKTIKSIRFLFDNCIEFDYLLRTNLSTIVLLDKFYDYLKLNNNIEYAGFKGNIPIKTKYKKYIDLIDSNNRFFPSGTCILMSKNIVKTLLSEELDYNIIDDLLIGLVLSSKYKITGLNRQDYINKNPFDENKLIIKDDLFIYRCKFDNYHTKTLETMNKLLKIFYNYDF